MLVPEMFCGNTKTVVAACKRHIALFKRGGSWVGAGSMVDVQQVPGLIALDGPSPLLGGIQVRLYEPFRQLFNMFVRDHLELETSVRTHIRAFDEALEQGWSVLGLLSQACYRWLEDPERAGRFLDAMMCHWDEIDAVGSRYTIGQQNGESLWDLPHLLKFVLARRGVPQPLLVKPLPPGGIAALLPMRS